MSVYGNSLCFIEMLFRVRLIETVFAVPLYQRCFLNLNFPNSKTTNKHQFEIDHYSIIIIIWHG